MSDGHSVELFALPPSASSEYYVWILVNWQEKIDFCRAIWHIAINAYMVTALLGFLAAARDGAVGVACAYLRMGGHGQGVLVPLQFSVRCEVDDIGPIEIFRCSGFDLVHLLMAYSWSSEVDWPRFDSAQHCFLYQLSLERIFDVPEWPLMSARYDAAEDPIPGSEIEPMHAVRWRRHGSLGFISASTLIRDTYCKRANSVVLVVAGR